jgi:hypothetical protein
MEAKSEYTFRTQVDRIDYERIVRECVRDDGACEIIRVTVDGLDGPEPITLLAWRLGETYAKNAIVIYPLSHTKPWMVLDGDHVEPAKLRDVRVEAF